MDAGVVSRTGQGYRRLSWRTAILWLDSRISSAAGVEEIPSPCCSKDSSTHGNGANSHRPYRP